MADRPLVLIHLSDIHLRKAEISSPQDLDQDIRHQLENDLMKEELPVASQGVDAILVTGDIAYAGDRLEYEDAHKWLKKLCDAVGCQTANVWVVPGNHDIQRSVVEKCQVIQSLRKEIRSASDSAKSLSYKLMEELSGECLFRPLQEYNKFAVAYGSETRHSRVAWEMDGLVLNDGSKLVFRGLNTALLSDRTDDSNPKGAILGLKQVQLEEQAGKVFLTLAHHPPDCLIDSDLVTDHLNNRAKIQLWGHKHRQRVNKVDECIIMGAGALHPSRDEPEWEPRYNVITVSVSTGENQRVLNVNVYQRVWKKDETRFGPYYFQNLYPRKFTLELAPWERPPVPGSDSEKSRKSSTTLEPVNIRQLIYNLYELPFPKRLKLLVDANLLQPDDEGISDAELIQRAIERVKKLGTLDQFEKNVESAIAKMSE